MLEILSALTICIILTKSQWSYKDLDWGTSDNFCGDEYTTQSPIDIDTENGVHRDCPSDAALNWMLGTKENGITSFELKNTGKGLAVTPKGKNLGILVNQFGAADEGNYCLDHFHFHWAKTDDLGSEHTINGKSAALEAHFVHYLCKYQNIGEAIEASKNPDNTEMVLGVVGILYYPIEHDEDCEVNEFLDYIISETSNVETADSTHSLSNAFIIK